MTPNEDAHLRRDLVQKITSLAERFAPDNEWCPSDFLFYIFMNTDTRARRLSANSYASYSTIKEISIVKIMSRVSSGRLFNPVTIFQRCCCGMLGRLVECL